MYKITANVSNLSNMNTGQPAGSNKLFFGYENDEDTAWLDYSEGITGTTTGNYTYYVVPKTNRGNIFLGFSNGGGGYFECEIGSVTVEHIIAAFQPMYSSVLSTVTDYYAFGSPMPGRNYNSPNYRYGFNGQEKDDEIAGNGNINTAEFWEYDTRLGRRWNIDPVPQVSMSDYACFADNPILLSDIHGDVAGEKDGDKKDSKKSISIMFYQKDSDIGDNLKKAAENGALLMKVNSIEDAANKVKEMSATYDVTNVSFVAHGDENSPSMFFGQDKINAKTINKYKDSFTKMGENMYTNGTICMLSCGIGRTDSKGDNKVLGNIAAWSGKATFGAKGFINQGAVAMGLPQNHIPFNSESRETFPGIYSGHGQFTIAMPALKNSNFRYAIFQTSSVAFSVHGPKYIEPSASLDRVGKRIDSAFKASDDSSIQSRKYQKFNNTIKVFK